MFVLRRIIIILNIRQKQNFKFQVQHVDTKNYGKRYVSYIGPKMWNPIMQELKNVTTLVAFKSKIKRWESICPFKICSCAKLSFATATGVDACF